MMTVHEISELTGLTIRTLQYYDKIGLLKPASYTESGYRLYGDTEIERLQDIMLFRELEFPLKDIIKILENPEFDRSKAISQQLEMLKLKREHIDDLIKMCKKIQNGGNDMDFDAFDKSKLEEYAEEAKKTWGDTPAYAEYEEKSKGRSIEEQADMAKEMMDIFKDFGKIKDQDPASDEAGKLVRKLQEHITKNYYKCTDEILKGLGAMYQAGGDFTTNIDKAGGEGTAVFVNEAIKALLG